MFDRVLNRLRMRRTARDPDVHLVCCAMCAADFVYPVDWEPVGETHWWMRLRCGACDTWREVTATNEVAARFDVELDRGLDLLSRTVHRIDSRQMATDVEKMILAIRHGLVDAADFAR